MIRPPPRSTLFPYPTLFRSLGDPMAQLMASQQGGQQQPQQPQPAGPPVPGAPVPPGAPSPPQAPGAPAPPGFGRDRKSTRLNSSHLEISYAVFCLKKNTYIVATIFIVSVRILTTTYSGVFLQRRLRKAIRLGSWSVVAIVMVYTLVFSGVLGEHNH